MTPKQFTTLSLKNFVFIAFAVAGMFFPSFSAYAASLAGTWSGSGSMTINSKGTERVRCRVTYSRVSGQTFSMYARCASGGGKLSQSGTLTRISGNNFQGSVYNAKYGVTASVYVKLRGRKQTVYISSAGGSGNFSLRRR